MSTVNNSRRPRSIPRDKSHLAPSGSEAKLPAGPIVSSTRGDSGCFLNKEIASTLAKVDSMSDDNTIEHIDSHKGQRLLHSTRPMITTWVGVQQDDLHDTLQKCSTTGRFLNTAENHSFGSSRSIKSVSISVNFSMF